MGIGRIARAGGAAALACGLAAGVWVWADAAHVASEGSEPVPSDSAPAPRRAPELGWESMAGETGRLSDLRGQPVLLHFWASWCASCREELPSLLTYSGDAAVDVVAVSLDPAWEPVEPLVGGPRPDVVRSSPEAAARAFGTRSVPETWVIDAEGVVRARLPGAADWSSPQVREAVGRALTARLESGEPIPLLAPPEGDCELGEHTSECG